MKLSPTSLNAKKCAPITDDLLCRFRPASERVEVRDSLIVLRLTFPMSDRSSSTPAPHKRRPRYSGKHPRRFEEKYKEHDPQRYGETVAKVMASGKTPAGTHRPIMVAEILEVLSPKPGEVAVDCTLGYGGHAQEILPRLQPGGKLLGLDADPIELPKAEARLRALGFGSEIFTAHRSNFAGLPKILACSRGF